ncbi:MAG TPA: M23 family metallopeptidase, partial [Pseudoflavonifractor sp.]|nr:M23 family metallopeptidase [Pseudoflavonifractor sp.]
SNPSSNAKSASSTATVFTWPVKGEIVDAYSPDRQRYDVTMGDWRTHAGIDIAAELGTQVKAAAKGTVLSIENDHMMGTIVTIDHGGDFVSVYANLSELPTVNVGDSVGLGDVIGAVGATAIGESSQAAHLHLAFLKGGSPADPLKYLPEQQ